MKINKKKQALVLKALRDGEIKRLGANCYSVPAHFFIYGITAEMIAEVDKVINERHR